MSSRRKFLKQLGAASLIAPVYSYATISEEELEKRIIPYERKHSSFDAINVGIIGFGIMGSRNAKTILQVPGIKLKAVCDLYKGRLERAKELFGADLFVTQSYEENEKRCIVKNRRCTSSTRVGN